MDYRGLRLAIGVLTGFIALTAIGGGIALLVGAEAERFPLEWLQDTPFTGYTIPALLLVMVVGGSALAACMAIFTGHKLGIFAAMVAGVIMIGYITGEVMILQQVPPGPTLTEYLYFGLGLVIFGSAGYIWLTEFTM
jgi:hypothetical protein